MAARASRFRTGITRFISVGSVAVAVGLVTPSLPVASGRGQGAKPSKWAAWIEPEFPFFSSVIDAGRAGPGFPTRNLTPRGLVLNLGGGYWAGFDTDLLRVAALWKGNGLTPKALAPGSYHEPDRKTPGGQSPAPEPNGRVWITNGIYPGWQTGDRPLLDDPREPAPSPEEVGRGPLPEQMGRLKAVRLVRDGVVLEYTAGGADVREWMTVDGHNGAPSIVRHFLVSPASRPLWLMLGFKTAEGKISLCGATGAATLESISTPDSSTMWAVRLPPHNEPAQFCAAFSDGVASPAGTTRPIPTDAPVSRWPQEVTTSVALSTGKDAYVVDDIGLPIENPWRRNVRPGDIQFLKDGTGVLVTLDGDVWFAHGLQQNVAPIRWRRFASGLHEPLTVAIRRRTCSSRA